jgi:hypothetical protein
MHSNRDLAQHALAELKTLRARSPTANTVDVIAVATLIAPSTQGIFRDSAPDDRDKIDAWLAIAALAVGIGREVPDRDKIEVLWRDALAAVEKWASTAA